MRCPGFPSAKHSSGNWQLQKVLLIDNNKKMYQMAVITKEIIIFFLFGLKSILYILGELLIRQ